MILNIRVKSSFDADKLSRHVKNLLDDFKTKTYNTARSLTPVRNGFAKRQWKQKSTSKGFKVTNETPYIPFLDQGSSRQAPKGISKPTVRILTGYVKNKTRRIKR